MAKKDYSKLEKDDLLKVIEKLESRKKYGLVWDEEKTKEQFEKESENALPVLKEVKGKEIKTDPSKPTNILIEGDNYHALSVLNYTHQGKIDVIYIDPPYNTGNKSWKYNNDFVEKEDAFRHSKWLSFMSKRIRIAKNLLPDNGIIVIAIDDYEHHTLRLLMDEIFGEENRLGTIAVVHNPRGRNDDKYFASMHEYMLVYAKNNTFAKVGYFELTDDEIDKYNKTDDISAYNETSFMRTGNNSTRDTRPKLFYPIYYSTKGNKLSLEKAKDTIELLPINEAGEEKTWRWGKQTFEELCDTELLVRNVKGKYRIFKKRRISNIVGTKPKTVWYDPRYDASTYGIMLLQNIFCRKDVFPYPKSFYTTQDIIRLISKKDSVVLDFF
ncbi:MAG: site-specific DNA-methyltransferase, partial [Minisyncoccia bacterium]